MDREQHWSAVYRSKSPLEVSWYRPHLELSLELIERNSATKDCPVLDVGGGASTLVDDLLLAGYSDVTVLDVADASLDESRRRLGEVAGRVHWMSVDFLATPLEAERYGICHDRAVFHFLSTEQEQAAYFAQAWRALRPDGVLIVATFALDGPERCSGLQVTRYDNEKMRAAAGRGFEVLEVRQESHDTPKGDVQKMMYFVLRKDAASPPVSS